MQIYNIIIIALNKGVYVSGVTITLYFIFIMTSIYLVEGNKPKLIKEGALYRITVVGNDMGIAKITNHGIEFTDIQARTITYAPIPDEMTEKKIGDHLFRMFY